MENTTKELIEQTQNDEDRGLLPKGYTAWMMKQLGVKNG